MGGRIVLEGDGVCGWVENGRHGDNVYFFYFVVGLRLFLCYGKLRITGIISIKRKEVSVCGCEDPWVD